MAKHTNPHRNMLEHPIFALPDKRIHPYLDDAFAALGRTPKWRRDRRPMTTHTDASFLQIAAGPGKSPLH
jgi:hypothetical protein